MRPRPTAQCATAQPEAGTSEILGTRLVSEKGKRHKCCGDSEGARKAKNLMSHRNLFLDNGQLLSGFSTDHFTRHRLGSGTESFSTILLAPRVRGNRTDQWTAVLSTYTPPASPTTVE